MLSWVNKSEKLLGFKPWTFLVGCSIITGISFPFIFLNTDYKDFLDVGFISVPFGLIYAFIITFGNAYIFYRAKTNISESSNTTRKERLTKAAIRHLFFTILFASLLGVAGSIGLEGDVTVGYVLRNIIGSLLLSSLIVVLFESFYYTHQLNKSEKREEQLRRQNVESQMEILKNQVKPHFLFNSLNTVISIIPDEPDKAIDYVQRLSKVYRYILEIKEKKLIPIHAELDCIKDYVFMLKIRFGDNLIFDLDEVGLTDKWHVVPLSLQLLIENAVKHNIISNKRPLRINIHKGINGSLLVSNNLQLKTQKMPSTGTGLPNIVDRYQLLTLEKVEVIQTQKKYTVSIPLIEVN